MNILVASAELAPFAKAGGLADIVQFLAIEWEKLGHTTIVVLPKYQFIDTEHWGFNPTDLILYVPISHWTEFARLWVGYIPNTNTKVYLIENQDYFGRSAIYGDPNEYPDNDRRFIFYSRAVFETAKAIDFYPDIIHAHDYHAAFTMAFLKSQYRFDPRFSKTAGVFTIHNLAYQGIFDPKRAMEFSTFGMKEFYPGSWFEHHGAVNSMKVGIMFADKITTVSRNYANEIRFPYFGEGLHDVLAHRGADLIGILNGVNYAEWSPENDSNLFKSYGIETLTEGKKVNKYELLKSFGVPEEDNYELPLIGTVTRLAEQKGIDLITYCLETHLQNNWFRFVILGSGEKRYEDYFRYLQWKYPTKALVHIGYSNTLAHRIIGGSDFLLLPSRYEPCGLTQMYALRYGTVPIVRFIGGFVDTVEEYNPEKLTGTGFTFYQYNADDMSFAISRAFNYYQKEPHWSQIRRNGMKMDFSAKRTAEDYIKVFKWALEKIGRI
ncbi:MAG: Glycogen synthase, ADP-glucose transglucosylase [Candidatus Kapaibacterium sp.]|nr:MAG: Glycogen synthase, ADP-glucose transglucosylase [Candidatus Kapabacteria bacterium]